MDRLTLFICRMLEHQAAGEPVPGAHTLLEECTAANLNEVLADSNWAVVADRFAYQLTGIGPGARHALSQIGDGHDRAAIDETLAAVADRRAREVAEQEAEGGGGGG